MPQFFQRNLSAWHAACSIYQRQARMQRDPAAITSLSVASRPPSDPTVIISFKNPVRNGRVLLLLAALAPRKARAFFICGCALLQNRGGDNLMTWRNFVTYLVTLSVAVDEA